MASFTWVPEYGLNKSKKPNVNNIQFGDGYQQRQAQGINTIKKVWSLNFSLRTDSEAQAIDDFLTARAGVEAFDWTDPDGETSKYVCQEWNKSKVHFNMNSITATFSQVFEP